LLGIFLVLAALACFALLDTGIQFVGASVPLVMAVWFRYTFQAISTTALAVPIAGKAVFKTSHLRYQLLRGVLLLVSSMLAFASLRHIPVGEYTAIVMVTPIVITLVAAYSLGERVSNLRWAVVLGGFLGVLIILRPTRDDFSWALLLPIALVITSAAYQVLTSRLARLENPVTMQLYTGWVGCLVTTLALPFFWVWLPDARIYLLLVGIGFISTVGHWLFIFAYAKAPAATLTPYLYGQIAFAMLFGWLVFAYVPDAASLLGVALIAICGALSAWLTVRESRALQQTAPEPVES
jgi:drug/metabolite transporter (DMT)-like permease